MFRFYSESYYSNRKISMLFRHLAPLTQTTECFRLNLMCVKLNMFCVLRSYSDYQFFTDIIWMMYKILQWTMQKQIKNKKCKKKHFKNTKKCSY